MSNVFASLRNGRRRLVSSTARRFAVGGLLAFLACSVSYSYTVRATLAPSVSVPEGTGVILGAASTTDGDGSIFEVEGPAVIAGEGDTVFEREDAVCCSTGGDTVNFYAYVDVDGNGRWDEGEPWGADPNNPVLIDDDGYVSEIVIDQDTP